MIGKKLGSIPQSKDAASPTVHLSRLSQVFAPSSVNRSKGELVFCSPESLACLKKASAHFPTTFHPFTPRSALRNVERRALSGRDESQPSAWVATPRTCAPHEYTSYRKSAEVRRGMGWALIPVPRARACTRGLQAKLPLSKHRSSVLSRRSFC